MEGMDSMDREGSIESAGKEGRAADRADDRESTGSGERAGSRKNASGRGKPAKRKKLTGSFAAKTAAFFLLAVCVCAAVASSIFTGYLVSEHYFSSDSREIFLNESSGTLQQDIFQVRDYIASGDLGYAKEVCGGKNLNVALLMGDLSSDTGSVADNPAMIWITSEEVGENVLIRDFYVQFPEDMLTESRMVNYYRIRAQKEYVLRAYIDMDFPEKDRYAEIFNGCVTLYNMRSMILAILGVSIFLGFNSFLFLMCSAGHRNDMEGVQPSAFTCIPLELHTAAWGIVAFLILLVMAESADYVYDYIWGIFVFSAVTAAEALWCTFYLRELAVRMKLGEWWKNTIIYRLLRLLKRILGIFWKGFATIFRGIPRILNTMIVFCGIAILEFALLCLLVLLRGNPFYWLVFWLLKKMILFPAVVYLALMCKKLLEGSRAIAEGRQETRVDTSRMFGGLKECGENLNNIGQGISKAVAERMKSEHLKTELITNVSHDIKTPLTSIINYANLIAQEPSENEKITEYSEVLVRQSGRLKKLLEDLLEASKATTGNLEVDLQPCEVGVILSQAIGEYQQRMEEKQLELIISQPEQSVKIMADGRHLWRVFDNLLNNVCKYAREDSRVYLSVETAESTVGIIFRNMSKYALNITSEELQERFVRGDRSRHMEGNGLGLSIAKSLTELQNGRMEVVTDGDLFKVSIFFEIM